MACAVCGTVPVPGQLTDADILDELLPSLDPDSGLSGKVLLIILNLDNLPRE